MWTALRDLLGVTALARRIEHIHDHLQRQEKTMAKLSDELADISNRLTAMRDAQSTSSTNVRDALTRLEQKVDELADGELSAESQAKVDEIKAELDGAKTAAESIDDGYEPPVVESSPFPETDDGSAGSGDRSSF